MVWLPLHSTGVWKKAQRNEACSRPSDLECVGHAAPGLRARWQPRQAISAVDRSLRGHPADDAESLEALGNLVLTGESVILLQADATALPAGLAATSTAAAVQMVAEQPQQAVSDEQVQRLTRHDAAEMLALALLTKPGPFTLGALSLGDFWGVKINGRLVAMAGERMKQPGYTELSGVCSHPEFRGGGLGRLLSLFVANQIFERGEIPYLHAYASNTVAIRLYESIGFRLRSAMNVAVIQRGG